MFFTLLLLLLMFYGLLFVMPQLKALDIAHRLGDVEMQRSILFILGSYRREEGLAPQSRAFMDQLGDHIEFAEQC